MHNILSIVAEDAYNTPRAHDQINLVEAIELQLKFQISPLAASLFANDLGIKDVANKSEDIQRVIINRYFSRLLFTFKANNKTINVTGGVSLLINDGYTDDWLKIMIQAFIPYIKINQIMY
jgi:hypothetical protein